MKDPRLTTKQVKKIFESKQICFDNNEKRINDWNQLQID